LNELFAGEAKIMRSTLPARAWPKYEAAIADFFNTKLPQLIDAAIAAEGDDDEEHGHMRQLRQGPNNIARDRPANDGKSLADALYLGLDGENGVKKALETSVVDVTATGDAQFSFKVYQKTNEKIAGIVNFVKTNRNNRIYINVEPVSA
jgi:hypothetical protein